MPSRGLAYGVLGASGSRGGPGFPCASYQGTGLICSSVLFLCLLRMFLPSPSPVLQVPFSPGHILEVISWGPGPSQYLLVLLHPYSSWRLPVVPSPCDSGRNPGGVLNSPVLSPTLTHGRVLLAPPSRSHSLLCLATAYFPPPQPFFHPQEPSWPSSGQDLAQPLRSLLVEVWGPLTPAPKADPSPAMGPLHMLPRLFSPPPLAGSWPHFLRRPPPFPSAARPDSLFMPMPPLTLGCFSALILLLSSHSFALICRLDLPCPCYDPCPHVVCGRCGFASLEEMAPSSLVQGQAGRTMGTHMCGDPAVGESIPSQCPGATAWQCSPWPRPSHLLPEHGG